MSRGFSTCKKCVARGRTKPSAFGSHSSNSRWVSGKRGCRVDALLAEHGEDGLRDPRRLGLSEARVESRRQIRREAGRCIGHRLLERAREDPLEVLPIARPALLEELVDYDARIRLVEALQALHEPLPIQIGALADHQRRLEQAQRMDELWGVESELDADEPAERVPDDVRALHAEVGQQPPAVLGLLREAHGSLGAGCCPRTRGDGRRSAGTGSPGCARRAEAGTRRRRTRRGCRRQAHPRRTPRTPARCRR